MANRTPALTEKPAFLIAVAVVAAAVIFFVGMYTYKLNYKTDDQKAAEEIMQHLSTNQVAAGLKPTRIDALLQKNAQAVFYVSKAGTTAIQFGEVDSASFSPLSDTFNVANPLLGEGEALVGYYYDVNGVYLLQVFRGAGTDQAYLDKIEGADHRSYKVTGALEGADLQHHYIVEWKEVDGTNKYVAHSID